MPIPVATRQQCLQRCRGCIRTVHLPGAPVNSCAPDSALRATLLNAERTNSIPKSQGAADPLADGELDGLSAATLRMTYGDRVGSRKAMATTLPNFVVLDKKVPNPRNYPSVFVSSVSVPRPPRSPSYPTRHVGGSRCRRSFAVPKPPGCPPVLVAPPREHGPRLGYHVGTWGSGATWVCILSRAPHQTCPVMAWGRRRNPQDGQTVTADATVAKTTKTGS